MVRESLLSPVMKGGHTDAVDSIRGWGPVRSNTEASKGVGM